MRFKKFSNVALAVTMTVAVLAGCGSVDNKETSVSASSENASVSVETSSESVEESKEIVFPLEETMEFTGLSIMCNTYYMKDNLAWNALLDRGNIKMELTEIAPGEMAEKGSLLMASGDYPEVLLKCAALDLDKYGMEGILIPLEDLIKEYAPNLTALLDERGAWQQISAPDGHIYSLPQIDKSTLCGAGNFCWWINKKWLDNLGLQEPKNQEELYNVLKAFKEKDANGNGDPNDEIPLTFTASGLGTLISWQEDVLYYQDSKFGVINDEFVYYPLSDEFKECLAFYKKLFEEELVDQVGYTQTSDQFQAIAKSGDIYGMYEGSGTSYVLDENRNNYVTLNSFNDDGLPLGTGVKKEGLAITDKCENPEVIIAWADYMYTEEGGRYPRMGVENVTYQINADGTYTAVTPTDMENRTYQGTMVGSAALPCLIPDLYYNVNAEGSPESAHVNNQMYMGEDAVYGADNGIIMPALIFTEDENEVINTLATDIKNYVDNYSAQVITGQLSLEDSWQEFKATLKKMNVEQLVDIYTDAYERAIAE